MPNKHYMKGYRKERKFMNEARQSGLIAFRSAGSHSPIDVITVDSKNRRIELIQCKASELTDSMKKKIFEETEGLDGTYTVKFYVI